MCSNVDIQEELYVKTSGQIFSFCLLTALAGGALCVMVTVVGNGHGDTSSNPGRD